MAAIAYDRATRRYPGSERPAVDALDLDVEDGELLVLVGPSGSGKSTALRMLAGLEEVDEGRIVIGGRDVTDLSPKDRDIAMVFQSYALYPHMTVAENMGFALKLSRVPRDETERRVREAATLLDLDGLLARKPRQLSGGQRQRVAMGRAIVRHPQAFLMDEPLSNLDAKLRVQTRRQIAALQRELQTTTVYVTHDQVEAMTMGDRVAVLKDGALQQVAAPRDMYRAPANVFVAGFMGSPSMNLLEATLTERGATCGPVVVELPADLKAAAVRDGSPSITLGFRPEAVVAAGDDGFPLVVEVVEDLGSDAYVHGTVPVDGGTVPLVARVDPARLPEKGDGLRLRVLPDALHVFSTTTGRRLAGHSSA